MVGLSMDGHGGIRESFSSAAGENRPELWLYFQVVAGPHSGLLNAAMGDPDGSDGCFSPYEGTVADPISGQPDWGIVRADYSRYQGTPQPNKFAFDFADDYFEPGDVIHYFYSAVADDNYSENYPTWALSSSLELREHFVQRCLPTAGSTLLLVDDQGGALSWWREGLMYNGYVGYDIYFTQAGSAGQENGLAGRADLVDIAQYQCIIWDSGNLQDYTVCSVGSDDKTEDDVLLTRYLTESDHATGLWMFGDLIANDLGIASPFLNNVLGAQLLYSSIYYKDVTNVVVPKVFAVDPELAYLGGEPSFWVYGGCPEVQDFSLIGVNPAATQASVSHEWEVYTANEVAGIKNLDPDGDGTVLNAQGQTNPVVFHPYSYMQVRDSGYAQSAGQDYARLSVGHVLNLLLNCESNEDPNTVPATPAVTRLLGNHPNPFNPTTTLSFSLAEAGHAKLTIYDISGRLLRVLVNKRLVAGGHDIVWDGKDDRGVSVASGLYFYKLNADNYEASDKMMMLK